jgi:integrase
MRLYKRRGSPHWWVGIGRKTRKSTRTTDREKAQEFGRVLEERLWRIHQLGDRSAISWNEAAERWLKDSHKPKKRDRWFIDWLGPSVGAYPVSAVADPDVLEELRQDGLSAGWSHSTVDRLMGTVSAVLHRCVQWRYLEYAPKVPMYRPAHPEPRALTPEELDRLCAHLPPHLSLAARFAVATMLRMRAMLRLTWDRVELQARRAWIPRSHQKAGRTFGLPLSLEAVGVLKELRKLNPEGNAVFQWQGRAVDDCNTMAFQKAVQAAKLGPLRWHDLRHTGASWAVQSGVTLQELMVLMDVRSYAIVLRYAHLAPSQAASAADRVAQWVAQSKKRSKRKSA